LTDTDDQSEQYYEKEQSCYGTISGRPWQGPGSFRYRLAAGDFQYRVNARLDTTCIVSLTITRSDHFSNDPTSDDIGQYAFETTANFNPNLALLLSDDEDHAVSCSFLANLPRLGNSDAKVFYRVTLEAGNGQNRDLMTGLLFELTQLPFELLCLLPLLGFWRGR